MWCRESDRRVPVTIDSKGGYILSKLESDPEDTGDCWAAVQLVVTRQGGEVVWQSAAVSAYGLGGGSADGREIEATLAMEEGDVYVEYKIFQVRTGSTHDQRTMVEHEKVQISGLLQPDAAPPENRDFIHPATDEQLAAGSDVRGVEVRAVEVWCRLSRDGLQTGLRGVACAGSPSNKF